MTLISRLLAALTLATVMASPALADTTAALSLFRVTQMIEIVDGEPVQSRELIPARSSTPGDRLLYRITLTNQDETEAEDITLTLPIDTAVIFVEDSLTATVDLEVTFSADAGQTFAPLADLVVSENGETRPATTEDLTAMRLTVPVLTAKSDAVIDYEITVE